MDLYKTRSSDFIYSFVARPKTVELKLCVKLPLKRQRPISPQNLSSFSFSCSPKNRTLSHYVRTGRGLYDTASACLIYYWLLGWPSFKHKLPQGARNINAELRLILSSQASVRTRALKRRVKKKSLQEKEGNYKKYFSFFSLPPIIKL